MMTGSILTSQPRPPGAAGHRIFSPGSPRCLKRAPGNIPWPDDQSTPTFQAPQQNESPFTKQRKSRCDRVWHEAGAPGGRVDAACLRSRPSFSADHGRVQANGVTEITIKPLITARLVAMPSWLIQRSGGRQFLNDIFLPGLCRSSQHVQYPGNLCLDELPLPAPRCGGPCYPLRESYKPTTDSRLSAMACRGRQTISKELAANNITVLFMVGAGDATGRRSHWGEFGLPDADGKMLDTNLTGARPPPA